ncbi:SDR family oxidoreductase [Muricoccus aerilatus]|uniref:SDR family oxidoreductase n=1 Tax=Muricoccus aerilatus TaxID=452982 RepID=UPI0005C13688|nr:SDR family oxidoreductase [Roseomonas aerilata]
MDLALRGRRAVVTGGSLGIGRAIARELAAEGVAVAIVARDAARLEAAARALADETGGTVIPLPADLSAAEGAEAAMEAARNALGGVDILVNNAGATPMGRIGDTPDATWAKSINLKLMGYARCARALTPAMRERRWGRVINIIGRSGHQPRANYIVGSSVNASLLAFTHALAQECAPDNVLVTGVNPGPIQTPRWDTLTAQGAADTGRSAEAENRAAVESTALGRLGTPEEVAGLIAFLCSDRAGYITGTMIDVDGGGTRCI